MGRDELSLQRILREHAVLRLIIERFGQAAVAALAGGSAQELRDAGRNLSLVLEGHVRGEEELLKSSAGTNRIRELHEGHAAALAELRRLKERDIASYAATAARLAPHLLEALATEERELLADAAMHP